MKIHAVCVIWSIFFILKQKAVNFGNFGMIQLEKTLIAPPPAHLPKTSSSQNMTTLICIIIVITRICFVITVLIFICIIIKKPTSVRQCRCLFWGGRFWAALACMRTIQTLPGWHTSTLTHTHTHTHTRTHTHKHTHKNRDSSKSSDEEGCWRFGAPTWWCNMVRMCMAWWCDCDWWVTSF